MSTAVRRQTPSAPPGFTLVELMIAIVVAGILVAVAFPSFMEQIRKGRRSDAFTAISAIQQAQERWRGNNQNYTTALADIGQPNSSPSGYYAITVAAPGVGTLADGYMVIASGVDGKSQANDSQCRKLGVQVSRGNVTYAGCGACADLVFANTHPCWSR